MADAGHLDVLRSGKARAGLRCDHRVVPRPERHEPHGRRRAFGSIEVREPGVARPQLRQTFARVEARVDAAVVRRAQRHQRTAPSRRRNGADRRARRVRPCCGRRSPRAPRLSRGESHPPWRRADRRTARSTQAADRTTACTPARCLARSEMSSQAVQGARVAHHAVQQQDRGARGRGRGFGDQPAIERHPRSGSRDRARLVPEKAEARRGADPHCGGPRCTKEPRQREPARRDRAEHNRVGDRRPATYHQGLAPPAMPRAAQPTYPESAAAMTSQSAIAVGIALDDTRR